MSETPESDESRRGNNGESSSQGNPLFSLIRALLSFFARAFLPDKNAPDFEDVSEPQKREQAKREYETRHKTETELPKYTIVPRQETVVVQPPASPAPREESTTVQPPVSSGAKTESPRADTPAPQSPTNIPAPPPAPVHTESDQIRSTKYASRLLKMRQEAEAANGGVRVEAIIPISGDGKVTSDFGHRHAPMKGASNNHTAVDFASQTAGQKVDVISAMPGIVVGSGWREGYGNTVDIMDVYGKTHRYAHLDSFKAAPGDSVAQGQKIGVMGMTGRSNGVHLHYEQQDQDGKAINPKLMGRTWNEGQRFTGKENQEFLAAQSRSDTAVAAAPQASRTVTAGAASTVVTPTTVSAADTPEQAQPTPGGAKPVRSRS